MKMSALVAALVLTGCATVGPKFNQHDICPAGSEIERAGEVFLIVDPADGYLSLWKDRWPWETSHLGRHAETRPKLELVCVEPRRPTLGIKQRQAVFKAIGTNDYIFGSTEYGVSVGGVVPEADVLEAQQLIGKPVWFAGGTVTSTFQKLDNLKPYVVNGVELGTKAMDSNKIYLIVTHQNESARVPIIKDSDSGNLTVPGKVFIASEPSPEQLQVSSEEFEMIKQGQVAVGMSEIGVYLSWGFPEKTNRTSTSSGMSKQLVYGSSPRYTKYVYIGNGTVTAIQD